jgi:AcrR family transcriptional regulator
VSRPPDDRRRAELLAAVVATCAERGLGPRSLRDIAAEVGTSHRMLIHHFGSREGLLVAVFEEVEARQAALAASLAASPGELLTSMWTHLSDPALRSSERLFFECYARGANGEPPFDRLVPAAVDDWLRPATTGGPVPDADPALTRLALAVVRGLLLDLVATGATDETTAALHRFAALVEAVPGTIAATPGRQVP